MNHIYSKLINYLVKNEVIQEEETIYYDFIFRKIISDFVYSCSCLLIGLFFNLFFESLLYLLVLTIKKVSGGTHAPTKLSCTFISYSHFLLTLYLSCHLPAAISVQTFLCIFSAIIIGILAPVDHKNKRLSSIEKKTFKKICLISSAIIIILFFTFSFIKQYTLSNIVFLCLITVMLDLVIGSLIDKHLFRKDML